jgi:copper chaperone
METIKLAISGMTCGHCVSSVRSALASVPGVQVDDVRIGSAQVHLDGSATSASTDAVFAAVQDAGYDVSVDASSTSTQQDSGSTGGGCCAPSVAAPTALSRAPSA